MPGASEPRLKLLRPQDFISAFHTALRGLGHRSIVVVGNYEFGPISVVPCRAKARPLRPRRSYFAPYQASEIRKQVSGLLLPDARSLTPDPWMVEAPGTAPGSERFIPTAIYCHSRHMPAPEYSAIRTAKKDGLRSAMPNLRSPQEAIGASCSSIHRIARAGASPNGLVPSGPIPKFRKHSRPVQMRTSESKDH